MRHRVPPDLDSGSVELAHVLSVKYFTSPKFATTPVGPPSEDACDNEDGGGYAVVPENRQSDLVIVGVSVIKGDDERPFRRHPAGL